MGGRTGIKVFAPGAVANFGSGVNILSAAVEAPGDELIATVDKRFTGVEIESITGYKAGLSKESAFNSASIAGQLLLEHLGEHKLGISFKLHKKIPVNSGLSSNAANAVAGAFAVNELLGRPLERYDLIDFAQKAASKFNIQGFPAQVASILFGGIILYRNEQINSFQKIYCPEGIQITLVIPSVFFNESEKLQFINQNIDYSQRIHENGNAAALISSLYTSDFNLFSAVLKERQKDQGLFSAYPYYEPIELITKNEGGFGCGIAGMGPVLYIATPNTMIASEITKQLDGVFKPLRVDYKTIQTKIDLNGVYKF
jgi:homoserine kinase